MILLPSPRIHAAWLAALALALAPVADRPAQGAEAYPLAFTVVQPDGRTKIRLHPRGSEFVHWFETEDGYTVERQRGRTPGFYVYAVNPGGVRDVAPRNAWISGRRVGIDPPPDAPCGGDRSPSLALPPGGRVETSAPPRSRSLGPRRGREASWAHAFTPRTLLGVVRPWCTTS